MNTLFYAILTKHGYRRATKHKPTTLKKDERAVKFWVQLPDAAFDPPKMLEVDIVVPPELAIQPPSSTKLEVKVLQEKKT